MKQPAFEGSITDVHGIRVGQAQNAAAKTGVTVILASHDGAVVGADVRGAAPGTRETDLCAPENTVERANANAHAGKGWQFFTDRIIEVVSEHQPHLVFLLWGAHAQSKQKLIDATKHLVLTSVHPSPLSAYRGFLGCGHFSRTNKFLEQNGQAPINWVLPSV